MRSNNFYILWVSVCLLAMIGCSSGPLEVDPTEANQFEAKLVKAMHLKLVTKVDKYGSSQLSIFKDTLVGYYSESKGDGKIRYYFIQNLKNPDSVTILYNPDLKSPGMSAINELENGCLYFGIFGANAMQSLCTDGTLNTYFGETSADLFYAKKVMLYKDKAAISSMNGIAVFDRKTEQVVYKDLRPLKFNDCLSAVIGNKLVYSAPGKSAPVIICLDLDTLKVLWTTEIKDGFFVYNQQYLPYHHLYSTDKDVIVPGTDNCYSLDLSSGNITGKISWKGYYVPFGRYPRYNVEETKIYLSDRNNLYAKDIHTGKILWTVKDAAYWDLYKNFIIGYSKDLHSYLMINRSNGKILDVIERPTANKMLLDVLGEYILINNRSVYR